MLCAYNVLVSCIYCISPYKHYMCSLTRTIKAAYIYTHSNKTCTFVFEPKSNAFPFPSIYKGTRTYIMIPCEINAKKKPKRKGFFFCLYSYLSASHSLINLCKSIEYGIYILFHRKDITISFHSMWNPILTLVFF